MFEIVVPLDGSSEAECALPWALAMAHAYDGNVTLLHVRAHTRGAETTYLSGLLGKLLQLRFRGTIEEREGDPAAVIVERAASAAMLVLATHGRGGFQRLFLGSVADRVIRQAAVPMLIVKERVDRAATDPAAIRHIAVLLSGEPEAEAGARRGVELATRLAAKVTFVHVAPWTAQWFAFGIPSVIPPGVDEAIERASDEYLAGAVERYATGGVTPEYLTLRGFTADAVEDWAHSAQVDLVCMTTHGRSGMRRAALGSVADRMVRSGVAPVLVERVRHGESAGETQQSD